MQTTRLTSVIILIMAVIYLICRFIGSYSKFPSRGYNRSKDKLIRSRIGKSLEDSAPIHMDINDGGETALGSGTLLTTASATGTVSTQMAYADEPWVITSSGGMAVNIEKDAVRMGMEQANYSNAYDTRCSVFSPSSSFEHLAGNAAAMGSSPSVLHLSVGSFGASPALADTLYSKGEILCVGGDDLLSQAVAAVSADVVYVGEQSVEIPDSLDHSEKNNSSLLAMDILRWVIVLIIVAFAGLGLTGI